MTMPAAHEPAFIVNSKLGVDAAFSPSHGPKATSFGHLTSTPESRSTSTGSLSPELSSMESEIECTGLPNYDYPVPLFVRNTFIDAGIGRPISLDEFYEERRVHSCPVESPPGLCSDPGLAALHPAGMPQVMPAGRPMMDSVYAAALAASAAVAAAARSWAPHQTASPTTHRLQPPMQPVMEETAAVPATQPSILRLADAIAEPELGSPELPTIGSTGHRLGSCKPCAFFHTKGCGNGLQCPFCHLCAAGEKKRRQKEKGAVKREFRRIGFMPDACI